MISSIRQNLTPLVGLLKLEPAGTGWEKEQVLEASIVPETNGVRIYYTGSASGTSHQIGCIEVSNIENTWVRTTGPLIGMGQGGALAGRVASASCVVKANGFYYCYALNGYGFPGEDRCVYLYRSANGITGWSDLGKVFNTNGTTILGYGNTAIGITPQGTVVQQGGYYYANVETWNGQHWQMCIFRSTSLESGWTLFSTATSLQVAPGKSNGGGTLVYSSGKWHTMYHYAPANGDPNIPAYYTAYVTKVLPTFLAYATSTDLQTWIIREAPILKIEANPYGLTDQIADAYTLEINGTTYLLAEYVTNDAAGGYDNLNAQIRLWKYPGTFDQLVSQMNIFANKPNALVANQNITFAAAGITAANTAHIREIAGDTVKTYIPGGLAEISGFTKDKGYYIWAKQDMDLTAISG